MGSIWRALERWSSSFSGKVEPCEKVVKKKREHKGEITQTTQIMKQDRSTQTEEANFMKKEAQKLTKKDPDIEGILREIANSRTLVSPIRELDNEFQLVTINDQNVKTWMPGEAQPPREKNGTQSQPQTEISITEENIRKRMRA